MQKYTYNANEFGEPWMSPEPKDGEQFYPTSDVDARIALYERVAQLAQSTLTEQRREFARGDFNELDELEDALAALRAGL